MAENYIFTIENLTKLYDRKEVLKNIWLSFYPGAKIGVIGSNGSGKSTLLRIMALQDKDFMGSARAANGITIGYVPQEPRLDESTDVRGNIEQAVAKTRGLLKRHQEIGDKMADPEADFDKLMDEMQKVQDAIDACNAWELDRQLEIAMDAMRLPPGDAMPETLSGGERRRVALCKTLLQKPDILLLDEPTNHLDAESVEWLEHHLKDYPGTVVAVTHDRYFLDNVAEMDTGTRSRSSDILSRATTLRGWIRRQARLAKEERTGIGPTEGAGPRTRMGQNGTACPCRQEQGSLGGHRKIAVPGLRRARRRISSCRFPMGRNSATWSFVPKDSRRPSATTCSSRT